MAALNVLPNKTDATRRYLPWIICLMAYLAALTVAGILMVGNLLEGWRAGVSGAVSVVLPVGDDGGPAAAERLAAVLRARADVDSAEVMDGAALSGLIDTWIDGDIAAMDLPLPTVVDVTLADPLDDGAALAEAVAAEAPAARVDVHRDWLAPLVDLAGSVRLIGMIVVVLIALAAAATVVFTTRAGLSMHHMVVEVLHHIGAQDQFIARQFQRQAFMLGLRGSVFGCLLAVLTLALLAATTRSSAAGLEEAAMLPWQWGLLAVVAAAGAVMPMITARLTVLRTLAQMP